MLILLLIIMGFWVISFILYFIFVTHQGNNSDKDELIKYGSVDSLKTRTSALTETTESRTLIDEEHGNKIVNNRETKRFYDEMCG